MNGTKLRCPYCKQTVRRGPVSFKDSILYQMGESKWEKVDATKALTIKNADQYSNPIFKLQLSDAGGNLYWTVPTSNKYKIINDWAANFTYIGGSGADVMVKLDAEPFQNGIKF
jgi:hypothetical protein